ARNPSSCSTASGVTDRPTAKRLRTAAAQLRDRIGEVCSVLPPRIGAPCGRARSTAALAACVVKPPVDDVHAGTVDGLADVLYGSPLPTGDHRLRRCRNLIANEATAYFRARVAALRTCRDAESARGAGMCPDAAAMKAADAARATLEEHVRTNR